MPSDDGLRLEDFHRVQHLRNQATEPRKQVPYLRSISSNTAFRGRPVAVLVQDAPRTWQRASAGGCPTSSLVIPAAFRLDRRGRYRGQPDHPAKSRGACPRGVVRNRGLWQIWQPNSAVARGFIAPRRRSTVCLHRPWRARFALLKMQPLGRNTCVHVE